VPGLSGRNDSIHHCSQTRLGRRIVASGYQLASIIAGGPAPFIATWLFATYQSTIPIGIYIVVCAIISIIATMLLPDYTNKDISTEAHYEDPL
jgi:hypothetical protein